MAAARSPAKVWVAGGVTLGALAVWACERQPPPTRTPAPAPAVVQVVDTAGSTCVPALPGATRTQIEAGARQLAAAAAARFARQPDARRSAWENVVEYQFDAQVDWDVRILARPPEGREFALRAQHAFRDTGARGEWISTWLEPAFAPQGCVCTVDLAGRLAWIERRELERRQGGMALANLRCDFGP